METSSPIFVTGIPRSGTTFLQHLLSSHPEIEILGQEPRDFSWGYWLQIALDGVESVATSNSELDYEYPHYAAPDDRDEIERRLLDFVRWYLAGRCDSRRWGIKSLLDCRTAAESIRRVWPGSRWVVCIRDPFRSLSSLWNTFDTARRVDPVAAAEAWVTSVRFAFDHDDAFPVFIDRLTSEESRNEFVGSLFEFLDESVHPDVEDFVADWPVIHKVVPDSERTAELPSDTCQRMLDEVPEFCDWVERLELVPSTMAEVQA